MSDCGVCQKDVLTGLMYLGAIGWGVGIAAGHLELGPNVVLGYAVYELFALMTLLTFANMHGFPATRLLRRGLGERRGKSIVSETPDDDDR